MTHTRACSGFRADTFLLQTDLPQPDMQSYQVEILDHWSDARSIQRAYASVVVVALPQRSCRLLQCSTLACEVGAAIRVDSARVLQNAVTEASQHRPTYVDNCPNTSLSFACTASTQDFQNAEKVCLPVTTSKPKHTRNECSVQTYKDFSQVL